MKTENIKTEKIATVIPTAIMKEFKIAVVQRGNKQPRFRKQDAWAEAAKLWIAREKIGEIE